MRQNNFPLSENTRGRSFFRWLILAVIRTVTLVYFLFMLLMLLHPHPWTLLGFRPSGRIGASALSIVHIAIFVLLALGVELGRVRLSPGVWLAALLVLGPVTETIQIFTGRGFEGLDILQDSVGVIIGTGIGLSVRSLAPVARFYRANE